MAHKLFMWVFWVAVSTTVSACYSHARSSPAAPFPGAAGIREAASSAAPIGLKVVIVPEGKSKGT